MPFLAPGASTENSSIVRSNIIPHPKNAFEFSKYKCVCVSSKTRSQIFPTVKGGGEIQCF